MVKMKTGVWPGLRTGALLEAYRAVAVKGHSGPPTVRVGCGWIGRASTGRSSNGRGEK